MLCLVALGECEFGGALTCLGRHVDSVLCGFSAT